MSSYQLLKSWAYAMRILTLIIAMAAVLTVGLSPVQALTCEDIRSLTKAEQAYWSKRLNLSAAQRHQIRVTCYKRHAPAQRLRSAGNG
jgi:hypothetical protein